MKKWKIILSSILVCAAAVACGTAVGCKKKGGTEYAKEWSYNSAEHWHEPVSDESAGKGSLGAHKFNDDYHCTTCGYDLELAGLAVTKTKTDYDLDGRLTRNIPTGDIVVKGVAADHLTEVTLTSEQYTLEYYKGAEKLDNLSKADGGAYNIWAKAEIGGEDYEGFVMVYVVDKVTEFARYGTFDTDQELGLDEISDSWKFTVTYSSGRQETIGVDDKRIEVNNFSTFVEASGKQAIVNFSETDCKGEKVDKSLTVTYNITKGENSNITYNEYKYDAIADTLADKTEDNQILDSSNFTADNSFLTLLTGTAQYRYSSSNKCLEIRGDTLSVTFEGIGMLVIGCRSTGDSNTSSIAVRDAEGNYVAASYPGTNTTTVKDDDDNIYSVTGGSGANVLTFYIDKPGTYTICTVVEVLAAGDFIDTNRYTRIERLEMTDIRSN